MFPYLDRAGFVARSVMPLGDIQFVEHGQAGFIEQRIASRSSFINARLRKRYGSDQRGRASLPFGQQAPALLAAGTAPPAVSLQGRPTLGSVRMQLQVLVGGPLATATFQWSQDNGQSWTGPVTTAASVPLGKTGMQAVFPEGSYSTDNVYAADTPVPEAVIGWLVALVTLDAYDRRGANAQDPAIERVVQAATDALAELKEAADSKDGLFDLPTSEDLDSAVTTGGPLGYSDASPYAWQDRQAKAGYAQDAQQVGVDLTPWNRIAGR